MRDKNLTYQQFNIQLDERLSDEGNYFAQKFLRGHVSISPTTLEEYSFKYPRNFRELRTLSILLWGLPEILKYRIWLDLTDMSFNHLNEKQIIELNIYLSSKENCYKYLYWSDRFTGNEIFGNFLGNDLRELRRTLQFHKRNMKLRIPQRVRGYRDHGSRKPSEKWLPSHDFTFTEQQLKKDLKLIHRYKTINRLNAILENKDTKS